MEKIQTDAEGAARLPQLRPDRWTAHDPRKCGADELPEGAPCRCGPFWPRPAAWWNGEMAIGRKQVETLIRKWRDSSAPVPSQETRA
jgi:hypothetical protein